MIFFGDVSCQLMNFEYIFRDLEVFIKKKMFGRVNGCVVNNNLELCSISCSSICLPEFFFVSLYNILSNNRGRKVCLCNLNLIQYCYI